MILIIGNPDTYESNRLKEELTKRRVDFKIVRWNEIVLPMRKIPELCLIRGSVDLEVHFAVPYMEVIIEELERRGCLTIPPIEMVAKCDKASTYLIWKKYLKKIIKMPETIITVNLDSGIKFLKDKKIAVFKPMIGGLGQGVELIRENEENKLRILTEKYGIIYLQEFIPNRDYDIRTVFIGADFTAQYIRFNKKEFRNNLHCGGVGKTIEVMDEIDPDIRLYCEKSEELVYYLKALVDFDMFAIDTIPSKEGELFFLEINPFFGFKGIDTTNNEDIAKRIVDYIMDKINGTSRLEEHI
ncbi:MAG: ATP-grasp domain-containing protein [Candidatus Helarchaeota archaeon]